MLAVAVRVSNLVIGLTVVAYGTSAPELVVSVQAAISNHGDVALGNVIGSSIANVGLILGSAALLRPARVDGTLRIRELPVLVASACLVPVMLLDGVLGHVDGVILLGSAIGYSGWMVNLARATFTSTVSSSHDRAAALGGSSESVTALSPRHIGRAALLTLLGLGVLLGGGHLFVEGAIATARAFGMTDQLVGLTIVAIGTSLPELVTSVVAAMRGESDIAIGNVIGSNIFNVLLCLGAAATVGSIGTSLRAIWFEVAAFLGMTMLAAYFIRTERTVSRVEGGIALVAYLGFLAVALIRA